MHMKYVVYIFLITLFISGCTKDKTNGRVQPPAYNVNAKLDVQYGQNTTFYGKTQKMLLDIYSPKDASPAHKYPLVVMAHGGSFLAGNKTNMAPLCQAIAEKGYIAVSIEYRLGWDYGNVPSPSACQGDTVSLQRAIYRAMQDYNASLRFLVSNASKYDIDTDWIFVGGASAGAVGAVNTTYVTPDFVSTYFKDIRQELGGLNNADNDLTTPFTISGIVSLWGAVIDPDLITPTSAVPMIAFHGNADETIPFNVDHYALCPNYPLIYGSKFMYDKLTSYNIPAVLNVAQNEGHDPDMYNDISFLSNNITCFLHSLISKTPESGFYTNLTGNCF